MRKKEFLNFILNVKPKFDTFERSFGKLMDFTNDVEHKEFEESIEFQEQYNHPIEPVILTFASSVEKLIKNVVGGAPLAQSFVKKLLSEEVDKEFIEERDSHLAELITQIRDGSEAQEGMAAFMQKRPPSWSK